MSPGVQSRPLKPFPSADSICLSHHAMLHKSLDENNLMVKARILRHSLAFFITKVFMHLYLCTNRFILMRLILLFEDAK